MLTALRLVFFMTIAAATIVGATAQEEPAKDEPVTIRVGVILELTGAIADFGVPAKQGIALAVEELNGASSPKRYQFEVDYHDTQSKPEKAQSLAKQIAKAGQAMAVVGTVASGSTIAAAPSLQEAGIPLITPTATNPNVTQQGDKVFRGTFMDDQQAQAMALHAFRDLKLRKAALVSCQDDNYSRGLATAFSEAFKKLGGQVVYAETYKAGGTSFQDTISRIKDSSPDCLFLPVYYADLTLILKEAVKQSFKTQLLGCDGWETDGLMQQVGKELEGAKMPGSFFVDFSEESKAFAAAYKKKFASEPNSPAALGYDTMKLLAAAVEAAKTKDSTGIAKALKELKDFSGVTGKVQSFDEVRNPRKPVLVATIKDQRITYDRAVAFDEYQKAVARAEKKE